MIMSIFIILLSVSCDALRLHSRQFATEPGIGTYLNEAYMPIRGPFKDLFFGRVSLTNNIWDLLPGVSFNPSIVALPEGKEFNAGYEKARFVAVVRTHKLGSQCANLGIGATQTREALFKEEEKNVTSLVLLDANFRPVTTLPQLDLPSGEDARLLIENGKMLISYNTPIKNGRARDWHLQCLELASQGDGGLMATRAPLTNAFPDLPAAIKFSQAKNLGVINYKGKAYLLFHANAKRTVTQPLFTLDENPVHGTSYHLSGNPVHIPEKGVYLSVLHKHKRTEKNSPAGSGVQYLHYFILMDDRPPFGLQKVSAPFCFPSQSPGHANECEFIQFVGSMLRDPQDPQTLMISYGINDCESAIVRLPLEPVLESIRNTTDFTLGDLGFMNSAPMSELLKEH